MARASKATRVTASTRPMVSGRRSGAHTPPVVPPIGPSGPSGPAGPAGAGAAWSVLTPASVKPRALLTSSRVPGHTHDPGQAGRSCEDGLRYRRAGRNAEDEPC